MDKIVIAGTRPPPMLAQLLAGYAAALLMVALATLGGLLLAARWDTPAVVLLYLLPVLAAAIYAGLGPGLVAAVASALAYNFYFTAPYRTFVIHNAADIVTVFIMLLVAVVTSQLAASVRRQARLAAGHAARNATIAGFARKLLMASEEQKVAEQSVAQIAKLFDCQAALLTGPEPKSAIASAPDRVAFNPSDLAAAATAIETGKVTGRGQRLVQQSDWQFHPVTAKGDVLAVVGLARDDGTLPVSGDQQLLLESLLDQAALALERARLDSAARDATALRELDRLRSALLTSIGDDVKPRLNALQAGLRTLRRDGAADRALVSDLLSEATRMDRYIDNLVDLAPGGNQAPLAFGDVTLDLHRRLVFKGGEAIHLTPKEFAVLAELAKHGGRVLSHSHLLKVVWGPAQQEHIDYLRVAIRALRQKLEYDPASPALIVNEPGVGYRLVSPAD